MGIDGYLGGEDVGLVENVRVQVERQDILTGYHPAESNLFVASDYFEEGRDYSSRVIVELMVGGCHPTVLEGTTEDHCN